MIRKVSAGRRFFRLPGPDVFYPIEAKRAKAVFRQNTPSASRAIARRGKNSGGFQLKADRRLEIIQRQGFQELGSVVFLGDQKEPL